MSQELDDKAARREKLSRSKQKHHRQLTAGIITLVGLLVGLSLLSMVVTLAPDDITPEATALQPVPPSPAAPPDGLTSAIMQTLANEHPASFFMPAGLTIGEDARLTASDAADRDSFGMAVAVDGNIAIVGAGEDDDNGLSSGSAYVFVRSGNVWNQTAKLLASNGNSSSWFGQSVAISGNTVIVGAFGAAENAYSVGAAYVFWDVTDTTGCAAGPPVVCTEDVRLLASDGANYDGFGHSVDIDGNVTVVGAPNDHNSRGTVYVFWDVTDTTGCAAGPPVTCNENVKLTTSDASTDDILGYSVALSGNTAIAGASEDSWDADGIPGDEDYVGSAYVFWDVTDTTTCAAGPPVVCTEDVKLVASDASAVDTFGRSVALSGNTAIAGANRDDWDADGVPGDEDNVGSAYVFWDVTDTTSCAAGPPVVCTEDVKLVASDASEEDYCCRSVAIDGRVAIIGNTGDDETDTNSGAAYVFSDVTDTVGCAEGSPLICTEDEKLLASDGGPQESLGNAVDIDAYTAIVGAIGDAWDADGSPGDEYQVGSAYVFTVPGHLWVDQNSTTLPRDGSLSNPYETIAEALAFVATNNLTRATIHIMQGTYSEQVQAAQLSSDLTFVGEDGSALTVICSDSAPVVEISGDITGITISGLTIKSGC